MHRLGVNNYYQGLLGDPNTGLSHSWSLGVEEQFYLLWAPAFIWLQNTRRETVAKVLAVSIVTLWLYRLGLVWAGVHQGYIYEAFDARADQLLLGCLLAFLAYGRCPKFLELAVFLDWLLGLDLCGAFVFRFP